MVGELVRRVRFYHYSIICNIILFTVEMEWRRRHVFGYQIYKTETLSTNKKGRLKNIKIISNDSFNSECSALEKIS